MTRKNKRKVESEFVFTTIYGRKYYVTGNTYVDAYLNFIRRRNLDRGEVSTIHWRATKK